MKIQPVKKNIKNIEKEHIELSWKILYHKALYYELPHKKKYDPLRISDDMFDSIAKRYEKLCKILNKKPTALCVGFDRTKPSHITALAKVMLDGHFLRPRRKNAR